MHREPLLNLIIDYSMRYSEERETTDKFIEFVRRSPDCFKRELVEGHITGSAWVVSEAGDKTLLTHHRKLDKWFQTGGHADGLPDVANVAMKEAKEESGLTDLEFVSTGIFDVDIHEIPARKTEPTHFHYDVRFAIRALGSDVPVISDESHDLKWVPLDELERYTQEESMLRMARKWRNWKG
ncbi:MAG: NUDIX hydrolase [Verrucomicrobiota bacterium]|nr:NUDIX hydrolase [Verrucomicrobiota bacterium]